jgi:Recombinase zinc beta ribbon domain
VEHQGGTKRKVDRPASEWITVEVPECRIVDDALGTAARARLTQTRRAYLRGTGGRLGGRPDTGLESRYLLTGLSACGVCGDSLGVKARRPGTGRLEYRCVYHATRGPAVCANRYTLPLPLADAEIVATLQRDVLTPARIERAITSALDRYATETATAATGLTSLTAQLARLEQECARLAHLLAGGEALPSLVEALRARERQRAALLAEQAHLQGLQRAAVGLDPGALRAEIQAWCTDWHGLLASEPAPARQLLRKVLVGKLVWTPRVAAAGGLVYDYAGEAAYGRLLAGVVGVKWGVPPERFAAFAQQPIDVLIAA